MTVIKHEATKNDTKFKFERTDEDRSEHDRFVDLAQKLVKVPKSEIDAARKKA